MKQIREVIYILESAANQYIGTKWHTHTMLEVYDIKKLFKNSNKPT